MISYELSEEQSIIRSMIGELALREVRPAARRMDDDGEFDDAILTALWSTQIIQSQALVDFDRSAVTNAIVLEELGAADASVALATAAAIGYACAIRDQGSDEQRAALGAQFQDAEFRAGAIALMEPRFGSMIGGLETKAERAGDNYILRGRKAMVPLASRSAGFLVIAEIDGRADAFIVARETDGVRIGDPKGTLGVRATGLAEVFFDEVRIPAAMRLGGDNGADVQRIIDSSRVAISAIMAGMCREIQSYTIPFVKARIVDGTPLGQRQSIAFRIADAHMESEAMRWMTWKAAWHLDHAGSAEREAQLAYSFAGQQAMVIADDALQAFGGHGYVKENPLEMWYRNVRTLSVLEGIGGV